MNGIGSEFMRGSIDALPQSDIMPLPETADLDLVSASSDMLENSGRIEGAADLRELALKAFAPVTEDAMLLRESFFAEALSECAAELKGSDSAEDLEFLREDLEPLLQNRMLLDAYRRMVIAG